MTKFTKKQPTEKELTDLGVKTWDQWISPPPPGFDWEYEHKEIFYVLEGEADFHLHHSLSDAQRNYAELKKLKKEVWEEYAEIGDCIVANMSMF